MTLARLAFSAAALFSASPSAAGSAHSISTFHSIGLYWSPPAGAPDNPARVEFRAAGEPSWRQALELWFDPRNSQYRGSVVELKPGTAYAVRLTLSSGRSETVHTRTWGERFKVKRTVRLKPGATRLVIEPSDSGNEREGYVVFTASPGANVIDQAGASDETPQDSCVIVRQGSHHIIIRGLVLRNCARHGVLLQRDAQPQPDVWTHDIVIEENEITGWGGMSRRNPGVPEDDGAIHCGYGSTRTDKRPERVVIQRNRIHDPRHGATPWQLGTQAPVHPRGPQGVNFDRCGANHVIRYNEVYSTNGHHYMDGIGGAANFSDEGFPWADSDIYGNRVTHVYDDAIEAEGANRNVRIWGNFLDSTFTAIANAATTVGPLYVWRNVSHRMAGMYNPLLPPDHGPRGAFIKAGSRQPLFNGGRAYYFHNSALQPPPPPGTALPLGAGGGILKSGGILYNFVSRNNVWHIHQERLINGQPKFYSIAANADQGAVDADFDVYNGELQNAGARAQRHGRGPGRRGTPVYASSGASYPDLAGRPGDFSLHSSSAGYGAAEPLPNFNDRYARPDAGAHQSGAAPMQFGVNAYR
jgi:hypothetical protein